MLKNGSQKKIVVLVDGHLQHDCAVENYQLEENGLIFTQDTSLKIIWSTTQSSDLTFNFTVQPTVQLTLETYLTSPYSHTLHFSYHLMPHAKLIHYQNSNEAVSLQLHTSYHLANAAQLEYYFLYTQPNLTENLALFLESNSQAKIWGGSYLTSNDRLNQKILLQHRAANSSGKIYIKNVLDQAAEGNVEYAVHIPKEAPQTEAQVINRNLLLSSQAKIRTSPQLEIYADEIRCTHGATIGQLSKEALLYLRSRGIALEQARVLLTQAFMQEIYDGIPRTISPH